jgi:hypothetical protein
MSLIFDILWVRRSRKEDLVLQEGVEGRAEQSIKRLIHGIRAAAMRCLHGGPDRPGPPLTIT